MQTKLDNQKTIDLIASQAKELTQLEAVKILHTLKYHASIHHKDGRVQLLYSEIMCVDKLYIIEFPT